MDNSAIIESFADFKDEKSIDRATLMAIIEEVFRNQLKKKYGSDENFDVIVNPDKGDLEIYRNRLIVADGAVEDENTQVALSEALKVEPDFEEGEDLSERITLEQLGRRFVLAFRQNLIARIQEHDSTNLFKKYKELEGEIVNGEVHHVRHREIILFDDDQNELVLPKEHTINGDFFRKGDTVRTVVAQVDLRGTKPLIVVSRTDPRFLEKLFETEIPEVFDGLITVKKVVRVPGEKAKVAVESYDDRIDPVGACVGVKGSRIHGIVRELKNENIDVINYTTNNQLLITRALAPAKITNLVIHEDAKRVDVFLKPDQVSLAIGRGGNNIKLAGLLTGYQIDVYRDTEEEEEDDVLLDEFSDEIEPWIIEELKNIGCDTARSVLNVPIADLVRRTDLEEETIREVQNILKAEFED
jgi:N utilization substance protein A